MHTGGGGRERVIIGFPADFKTLVNKNAMIPEIGGPPGQFFLKALTPLGIFAKTSGTPSPGFSTREHLWCGISQTNVDWTIVAKRVTLLIVWTNVLCKGQTNPHPYRRSDKCLLLSLVGQMSTLIIGRTNIYSYYRSDKCLLLL
jgi:hypothetical protein